MAKKLLTIPVNFSLDVALKENPELKESDLQMLKEWCEKQPHLPKIPDLYLVMFLNSNYYRIEPTKNTIEHYFTLRTHVPEFFSSRDPIGSRELRKAFNIHMVTKLEGKSFEGYDVYYARLTDFDVSHFNFNDNVRLFFMYVDLLLLQHATSKGLLFVGDCVGFSFGHLARVSPMGLKKLVYYVQDALPLRLKGIHCINTPPVIETIVNMAKPFMNGELLSLINLHTSTEPLTKYMSLDILPDDRNGKAGPIDKYVKEHAKIIEDHRDWFLEEQSVFRVNESLRVGKSKSASDLFGVEGSFKKLEID